MQSCFLGFEYFFSKNPKEKLDAQDDLRNRPMIHHPGKDTYERTKGTINNL